MVQTKADRVAAGKAGQKALAKNKLIEKDKEEAVHDVESPEDARDAHADALSAYGLNRDSLGDSWEKPSDLDAPPPRAGFTQRWIRYRQGNDEDAKNTIKMFRQGWLPRPADSVPEGLLPPTVRHPKMGNVIGVDDLILCEIPIAKAKQRNAYYEQRKMRMIEGIENDIRKVDRHGPRIDMTNRTRVTKRRLRIPDDPAED